MIHMPRLFGALIAVANPFVVGGGGGTEFLVPTGVHRMQITNTAVYISVRRSGSRDTKTLGTVAPDTLLHPTNSTMSSELNELQNATVGMIVGVIEVRFSSAVVGELVVDGRSEVLAVEFVVISSQLHH